uniref:hypothetical protein n=1 Tax=Paractinoplanes polyasparticus TaxID=2856853 RepID=UPI001C842C35|nr:hypothetical protein [Actinoplanes polyasparticus]
MPEPPAGPSPAAVRRTQAVIKRASGTARAHGALPPAAAQVGDAREAVVPPPAEGVAKAQQQLIGAVREPPSPEIVALGKRIREVIRSKRPPDEDALVEAKPEEAAKEAGSALNESIQGETSRVEGSYEAMEQTAQPAAPPPGTELPPQPAVVATAPIEATAAVPDAVPAKNVSLTEDATATAERIKSAGMTTEPASLVQTGPVAEARAAQGEFDQLAADGPARILAQQRESLAKAEADMAALQVQAVTALETSRVGTATGATTRQRGMVGSEESMRAAASERANQIFKDARTKVMPQLKDLPSTAMAKWDAAKVLLSTAFKSDLKVVSDRISKRHSGVGGFFVGVGDFLTGLPGWVERDYTTAETKFADGVVRQLEDLSSEVNTIIAACNTIIETARTDIKTIFDELPASLQEWAAGQRAAFDGQLDRLHEDVEATRTAFVKDLKRSSTEAVDEARAEIAEARRKASSLLDRIIGAVTRFLDDPIKFIIDGLLELVGIPPASFWAVVAKIKKVAGQIADDPLGFAGNLLKGLADGFGAFFDHLGGHLLRGFVQWLLGNVKDIAIPTEVTLRSVATFFLQLMGITWANIRKILVKHVGAKNVALAEKVWSMLSTFIDKGPDGIVEMIKEKLDPKNIVDEVIRSAVEFMTGAIVSQIAARILLLFNPAGAILQAIEAIYKVLRWIFENAASIFSLIETVVDGVVDLLAGNTTGFAAAVEKALAGMVRPVIAFIADYTRFRDLPKIVAEKVKSMREWVLGMVEKAVVWLIEKGKALLESLGLRKKKDPKGEKYDGTIGETVRWSAEGEHHQLWIEVVGDKPEIMMASDHKGPVRQKLDEYRVSAAKLKDKGEEGERRKRAETAIGSADTKLAVTLAAASAAMAAAKKAEGDKSELKAKDDEAESWEEALWPELQTIQIALRVIELPETEIKPTSGAKASKVTAEPLSDEGKKGSAPRGRMLGWDHVVSIDRMMVNKKRGVWGVGYWVAGHLVSEKLHGPGDPFNTVPLRKKHNAEMEQEIESDSKERIAQEEVLYYSARVEFHKGDIVENFPRRIEIERGTMRYQGKKWRRADPLSGFSLDNIKPPPLAATARPDLNDLRRQGLLDRHVPQRFAMAVEDEHDDGGDFAGLDDFVNRMTAVYMGRKRPTEGKLDEGIASIVSLLLAKKITIGEKSDADDE